METVIHSSTYSLCATISESLMQEGHIYGKKGKRTCVLLAIGEQGREIQNAQINFIKVRRQKKKSDL